LDAQRGEVFLGEYDVHPETLQATSLRQESLVTREVFLTALPMGANVATPDQSIAALLPPATTVRETERPGAEWIARIGLRKILAGQTVTAADLDANYVRRSDAEIFSTPGS